MLLAQLPQPTAEPTVSTVVWFFNNLPEVLQESPALYITLLGLAAGYLWLKLPPPLFPASLRYPFVMVVSVEAALSVIHDVPRAIGQGFLYGTISIASFATVREWLLNRQRQFLGSLPQEPLERQPVTNTETNQTKNP